MKNLTALALAACAALTLTACGGDPNEWDSPEQRDAAFAEYACERMAEEEPGLVGSTATSEAFDMGLDAADRGSVIRHATLVTAGTVAATCDASSPDYHAAFVKAWENAMEEQEGAEFTPQVARDRGIDVE